MQFPGHKPGWCIHYRAPSFGPVCAVGVTYTDLRDVDGKPPKMARSPCFIKPGEKVSDRSPCPKVRPPTDAEIQAWNDYRSDRISKMIEAFGMLEGWLKEHAGKSARTVIECPKCKGKLQVVKNGSNDHTVGKCETVHCLTWIQ